jgi:hypothetical protein
MNKYYYFIKTLVLECHSMVATFTVSCTIRPKYKGLLNALYDSLQYVYIANNEYF